MNYLTSLSVIEARGQTVIEFLQGQLTADLNELDSASILYSALCNPKGRVLADLYIIKKSATCCLLLCDRSLVEILVPRLNKFGQFSDCVCTPLELSVAGHTEPGSDRHPITPNPGLWLSLSLGDKDGWTDLEVAHGIPRVTAVTSGQFTAHMLSLDQWHALSLKKGCYVGQEIIARTHYRGQSKKKLWHYSVENAPDAMTVVDIEDRSVTVLRSGTRQSLVVGSIDLTPSERLTPIAF